ncbi:unnamed protein product [Lota lota]
MTHSERGDNVPPVFSSDHKDKLVNDRARPSHPRDGTLTGEHCSSPQRLRDCFGEDVWVQRSLYASPGEDVLQPSGELGLLETIQLTAGH